MPRAEGGGPLLMKQLVATIDERTTVICLDAAGQLRLPEELFNTLNGDFIAPPFHLNCRDHVAPWLPGFIDQQRAEANAELMKRPLAERKKGPGGVGARRIPVPDNRQTLPPAPPTPVPTPTPPVPPPPKLDPLDDFLAAFEQGHTVVEQLSGGNAALSVEKVRLSDGRLAVLKEGSRDETDREVLAAVVLRAVGVELLTVRVSPTQILTEFVEGRAGVEFTQAALAGLDTTGLVKKALWAAEDAVTNAELERVAAFPQGKQVGLADWLIQNSDRHVLNWIAVPVLDEHGVPVGDPKIVPIDHGHAQFIPAEPFVPNSPFAHWLLGLPYGQAFVLEGISDRINPRITAAELADVRAALEAVKDEFKAHPLWFEHIMDKLSALERAVS